jgi:hypothetical protein
MKKLLWTLFSLGLLLAMAFAIPARAQGPVTIEAMTVKVWPEYDRQGALVFYVGRASGGGPANLTFNMPPGAALNAAAYSAEDGSLLDAGGTQAGNTVSMASPNGSFHVEFYDSSIEADGDKRSYALTFNSQYDITAFNWEVQQPAAATGFTLNPSLSEQIVDEMGLVAFRSVPSAIKAGDPVEIGLEYSRAGGGLTIDRLQSAQPAATPSSAAGSSSDNTLVIVLAVLGGAVIIGVIVYYFRQEGGFGVHVVDDDGRRKGPRSADKKTTFCPRCGTARHGDDQFCRKCGAKLG